MNLKEWKNNEKKSIRDARVVDDDENWEEIEWNKFIIIIRIVCEVLK
jgi:hypothetical protein